MVKPSIVFIVTRLDSVGGAQIHVRDLSARLAEDGWRVSVLTGDPNSSPRFLHPEVELIVIPSLRRDIALGGDWLSVHRVREQISGMKPDLVSLHSTKAGVIGRLACRQLRQPCIFTAHGWVFSDGVPPVRRRLYRACESAFACWAQRIIAVSDYDYALGQRIGVPVERLRRIHNGVPDQEWIPRKSSLTSQTELRVAMVARFDKQKDQALLLRAMSVVQEVRCTLVGNGPLLEQCKALSDSLGLSERVKFIGYQADIAGVLRECDVFVLCSKWEGFPRTTLEAMRAGLPVIVSDVGGSREAVDEGGTGFCIQSGDLHALVHRLQLLVRYPELRSRMGNEGRKKFLEYFTFDRMYAETCGVYREMLSGAN